MHPALLHWYLAMLPAREMVTKVRASDSEWSSLEFQGQFVRNVLAHPIAVRFPPAAEYRRVFLRLYIDAVARDGGGEYDDDLMELYTDLMQEPSTLAHGKYEAGPAPPPHYRTFFLGDGSSHMTLQLRKGFGAESTGGTGAALWEAS